MTMECKAYLSEKAKRDLKKIDKYQAKIIYSWIKKNLDGCENPRAHGKPLTGGKNGYWCYRVGSYRLLADITDREICVDIINIGYRREIY